MSDSVVDFEVLRQIITAGSSDVVDARADLHRALAELDWNASRPAVAQAPPAEEARMLTPQEAVAIVGGGVSVRWLLRHTRGLRFRRDHSRKVVRFEEAGLRRWVAARRT